MIYADPPFFSNRHYEVIWDDGAEIWGSTAILHRYRRLPNPGQTSEQIGRNVVDNFETAMHRIRENKGYIVAYSFGSGAYEEAARAKNREGLEIVLITVEELLRGRKVE